MASCLIGLGSNLGDRIAHIEEACRSLQAAVGTMSARSSPHATHSVGGPAGQPEYLNAAVLIETMLAPEQVLVCLLDIEAALGRKRAQRWGERTIDLDLLLYEQTSTNSPALVVPHPRMAFRRFVLEPSVEIAPTMIHPTTGFTLRELLERLAVKPIHVALLGDQATEIGRVAAASCGASVLGRASFFEPTAPSRVDGIDRCHRVRGGWEGMVAADCRVIISDFWIGEWLLQEPSLDSHGSFPIQLTAPHLLIWLQSGGPTVTKERDPVARAVWQPRQFPVLNLAGASKDVAVAETTAAIQAIQ